MSIFKKKKAREVDLPPPPRVPSGASLSDIPDISMGDLPLPPKPGTPEASAPSELPEFPAFPSEEQSVVEELPKRTEPEVVFDKTISMAEEHPPEILRRSSTIKKLFVSSDDYSMINRSSEMIRERLAEAEHVVKRLHELKNEENKAFDRWLAQVEELEQKLSHVDRVLARAQG